MTALNLIVGQNAAYLLADAAVIDEDGLVQHIATKIVASERLNCAIAHTGGINGASWHFLKEAVESCGSQLELLRALPTFARHARELVLAAHTAASLRLVIGLWSAARQQPEGYVLDLDPHALPPGMLPGELNGCRRHIQPEVAAGHIPQRSMDRTSGLDLINAQRREVDDRRRYIVGGAAELVTVRKAGVEREIIRRWRRDRLGRRIHPSWLDNFV